MFVDARFFFCARQLSLWEWRSEETTFRCDSFSQALEHVLKWRRSWTGQSIYLRSQLMFNDKTFPFQAWKVPAIWRFSAWTTNCYFIISFCSRQPCCFPSSSAHHPQPHNYFQRNGYDDGFKGTRKHKKAGVEKRLPPLTPSISSCIIITHNAITTKWVFFCCFWLACCNVFVCFSPRDDEKHIAAPRAVESISLSREMALSALWTHLQQQRL